MIFGKAAPINCGHKKARVDARAVGALQMIANMFSQKSANGKQHVASTKVEPVTVSEYRESDKTSFAKHLRWKLQTRDVEWMDITPEMAKEMLKYNETEDLVNRPQSRATIQRYARIYKEGGWGVGGSGTCEPIIYSDALRLLSGQHRLLALLLAGVSQRFLVVFGEPDGNFAFIDQGRRRTAADVFAVNRVPNQKMAAAAVRWLVAYESGSTSGDDAAGNVSLTNQEAYDAYLRLDGLQESIAYGQKFARDRLPCPAMAAAVHYLCAQKSARAANEYFDKVATGVGFSNSRDPAKKVRDFLTRSDSRVTRKQAITALIQGWNAIRTNKAVKRIDAESVGRVI